MRGKVNANMEAETKRYTFSHTHYPVEMGIFTATLKRIPLKPVAVKCKRFFCGFRSSFSSILAISTGRQRGRNSENQKREFEAARQSRRIRKTSSSILVATGCCNKTAFGMHDLAIKHTGTLNV